MNQNSNHSKIWFFRLFVITPLLALVGIGAYLIFSNEMITFGEFVFVDDLPLIRIVEDDLSEGLTIIATGNQMDGYELYAMMEKNDDFSFVDAERDFNLNLQSQQDTIYIIFENFLPNIRASEERIFPMRDTFILKMFYEFEEIKFRVENQHSFHTEFLFNLSEGYQIHIPIQLSDAVEVTNEMRNLTIAVFPNPEYHTVNPLAQWYSYCADCFMEFSLSGEKVGIVSNFALSIEEGTEPSFHAQEQVLEETALILAANPEFLAEGFEDLLTSGVPSPWIVSPGEEVKIGFALHHASYVPNASWSTVIDDFVIVGLLNWEQVTLNIMPYFLENSEIGANETVEGYFVINAPDEPGYYDFVAFAIGNTSEVNRFLLGAIAERFTLKVD